MASIYLDDGADSGMLAVLLREAGYEARTPRTDGTRGLLPPPRWRTGPAPLFQGGRGMLASVR